METLLRRVDATGSKYRYVDGTEKTIHSILLSKVYVRASSPQEIQQYDEVCNRLTLYYQSRPDHDVIMIPQLFQVQILVQVLTPMKYYLMIDLREVLL